MKDLTSSSPEKVRASLDRARKKGDATWIQPLLEAFTARKEDDLREDMSELLGTLKVSAAEDIFLRALSEPKFSTVRADILGFLWSCGFTCDGQLALIAEVACEGDFRQAMEGATLIEQVESVANEKDVLEAQVVVAEALQDEDKTQILPFVQAMAQHLSMLSDSMA